MLPKHKRRFEVSCKLLDWTHKKHQLASVSSCRLTLTVGENSIGHSGDCGVRLEALKDWSATGHASKNARVPSGLAGQHNFLWS